MNVCVCSVAIFSLSKDALENGFGGGTGPWRCRERECFLAGRVERGVVFLGFECLGGLGVLCVV